MKTRKPADWYEMRQILLHAARELAGGTNTSEADASRAMLSDPLPDNPRCWWDPIGSPDAETQERIDAAARAFARGEPRPPLSPADTGRLALRVRLASAFCRGMSGKPWRPAGGRLARSLARMPREQLLETLLVDLWPSIEDVLTETLQWQDSFRRPWDLRT